MDGLRGTLKCTVHSSAGALQGLSQQQRLESNADGYMVPEEALATSSSQNFPV